MELIIVHIKVVATFINKEVTLDFMNGKRHIIGLFPLNGELAAQDAINKEIIVQEMVNTS